MSYVVGYEFYLVRTWTREQIKQTLATLFRRTPILRTILVSSEVHGFFQVVVRCDTLQNSTDLIIEDPWNSQDSALPVMGFGDSLVRIEFLTTEAKDQYQWLWTGYYVVYYGWSVDLILKRFQQLLIRDPNFKNEHKASSLRSYVECIKTTDHSLSEIYWRFALSDFQAPQFPAVANNYRPQANKV